jgi:hypothetical protein
MMDRGRTSAPFPPEYRASGILLHVTSLSSRHGIGDLGPALGPGSTGQEFRYIHAHDRRRHQAEIRENGVASSDVRPAEEDAPKAITFGNLPHFRTRVRDRKEVTARFLRADERLEMIEEILFENVGLERRCPHLLDNFTVTLSHYQNCYTLAKVAQGPVPAVTAGQSAGRFSSDLCATG